MTSNYKLVENGVPISNPMIDLMVPEESHDDMKAYASLLPSIQISARAKSHLEMLATGGYSPLDRFMGQADLQNVLRDLRLTNGHLFPIPVTLSVSPSPDLKLDQDIALRDSEFQLLGIITLEEIYPWEVAEFATTYQGVYSRPNSFVSEMQDWGSLNISGQIKVLNLPRRHDFDEMRRSPSKIRETLARLGAVNVIAYVPGSQDIQKFNRIVHLVDEDNELGLLVNMPAGEVKLGDMDFFNRIRYYQSVIENKPGSKKVLLNLSSQIRQVPGFRESIWSALISRNYGASTFLLNSEWDGDSFDKKTSGGNGSAYLVDKFAAELGIHVLDINALDNFHFVEDNDPKHWFFDLPGDDLIRVNRSELDGQVPDKQNSSEGDGDMATLLANLFPPRHEQGVCIWFTGLSGSGKSTTAEMLSWLIMEHGRKLSVLDGDVVRTHLSKGLGFSKKDRDINVRRIGFVASELVQLGSVVICAVVSPYRDAREAVRVMVGDEKFIEVYVDTPLEVCEDRDVKGMYAKARKGEIKGFTGIDDPYEAPLDPEIRLDTLSYSPQENARLILAYLIDKGFVLPQLSDFTQKKIELTAKE